MDHANARFLAEGLARIPGIQVDPAMVESNIVVFDISASGLAPTDVSVRLRGRGVLINAINQRCLRAVTHYDVDRAQCAEAVEMVAESMAAGMTAAKPS
jgi:threonine aldolase